MDLDHKFVAPIYIRLLLQLLEDWGVQAKALLEGTGITPEALADPTALLSVEQEINIYERANQLSPAPEWALRVGQSTTLASHGVYGYAVMTSADLDHALQMIVRFFKLAGSAAGAQLRERSCGDYELRVVDTVQRPSVYRQIVEEFFSSANTALAELAGSTFRPKCLYFDYSAPGYKAVYDEVFGCPLHFDAPYCGFVIDQQDLQLRVPTWDPMTVQACERQCEQVLQQLAESEGFIDEVRKVMIAQACDRRGADFVAEKLHMSTRNLRRKLEREGSSFQQVLDDVRCELAKNYLSQSRLRLEDIAPLLGFAETANLRRAFKKWTGRTPSEYRADLQEAAG